MSILVFEVAMTYFLKHVKGGGTKILTPLCLTFQYFNRIEQSALKPWTFLLVRKIDQQKRWKSNKGNSSWSRSSSSSSSSSSTTDCQLIHGMLGSENESDSRLIIVIPLFCAKFFSTCSLIMRDSPLRVVPILFCAQNITCSLEVVPILLCYIIQ